MTDRTSRRAQQKVNLLRSSSSTRLSTGRITRQKYFNPMEKHEGPHKNDFCPIKNKNGPIMTKTVKKNSKQFQPIREHAWENQAPYHIIAPDKNNNVANTCSPTCHETPQLSRAGTHDMKSNGASQDQYLSQLKFFTHHHEANQNFHTMKAPTSSILKKMQNPVAKTRSVPHKLSSSHGDVKYLTPQLLEQANIKALISAQRSRKMAQHAKRDAIIAVQEQFFTALKNLYSWPADSLILADINEVRNFWEHQLLTAKQCAYRAETIDPNHYGELRYDIMAEIVKLESCRITEFLEALQHYQGFINSGDMTDERECDNVILSFLDQTQTNVIHDTTPQWISDARRPPLTWYALLTHQSPAKITERILAPDYYDSPEPLLDDWANATDKPIAI